MRGPAVAKGYWNMEKETRETFLEDGWFLTGDIGYIDQDNRLFITDRKKDMIVMSGWKIYPTEVEEILIKHPAVEDLAVFSIDDCHKGELPVVAVIWKEDVLTEDNEEELKADLDKYARERLARYKVPHKIFTTNKLPRVNNWKLLRRELKEEYNIYADMD
ncbi:MAG: class I adenylate-forming enzyme family protein [Methanobrevibacter boviskoreani]|uniref:class I adenylate-forming enzyme family protein n=1 Tax=Methanobrevibacter boviskoreani TaxID=1348249 RepID=UPI003D900C28